MNGLMLAWALMIAQSGGSASPDWQTTYERSGYLRTGRYAEAVDYCRRLASASPWAHLLTWGVSPEGRPLIALVLSKERAFTPEAARQSRKPLVILNNGIHSGEIEGKDAGLLLARNILITKTEATLLDHVNLLFIPVFSVDAHERFGPYNRINQNGPTEMGWRATSTPSESEPGLHEGRCRRDAGNAAPPAYLEARLLLRQPHHRRGRLAVCEPTRNARGADSGGGGGGDTQAGRRQGRPECADHRRQ